MDDPNTIYMDSQLWLPKSMFKEGQIESLRAQLTYSYGDSNYKAAKNFVLYTDRKDHLGVPRHHFLDGSLERFAAKRGIPIVDRRPTSYETVEVESTITLDAIRPEEDIQTQAYQALVSAGDGILTLACGRGKSPIALHLWATKIRGPLLVMADNTSILTQWERMIREFLVPKDLPIGHIYEQTGEKAKGPELGWAAPVVLASVQSVYRSAAAIPAEIRNRFALVVIDELHKVGAPEYCKVAPIFAGRRLGLTATPERTDRLDRVYKSHFGEVLFRYLRQPLTPAFQFFSPASTLNLMDDPAFRKSVMSWGEVHVAKMWTALARCAGRTQEIVNLIRSLRAEGRRVLVISQRKELLGELNKYIPEAGLIIGKVTLSKRAKVLATSPVVLGIQGIAKEGLDAKDLDSLVVCEPFKDANLFQQVIGRILRDSPGKQSPKVVVVEDALGKGAGPVYGLCRRMRSLVENWPASLGGPYTWTKWAA